MNLKKETDNNLPAAQLRTKGRNKKENMKRFTATEDEYLLANYLTMPMKRIAKMLGRADSVAGQRLHRLGYSVPKDIAARFAEESRMKKGNVPPNKGVPQSEWLPEASMLNVRKTMFKPGNKPQTYLPVGSERVTRDGYKEVKTADPNKWEALHRVEWEKVHGSIAKGMVLVFKGSKLDPRPENCELITRVENMRRNSYHNNYPKEIANLIQLRGALNRKINKKRNEKQNRGSA